MPNEYFNPEYSTYQIFRAADQERCLDDDLAALENGVAGLQSGKAPTNHVHDGYAPASHTHEGYAPTGHTHTGFASADHEHDDYAPTGHTHSGFAPSTHGHAPGDVTGLGEALGGKADLVGGKVPASQLPSYVDDVIDGTLVSATVFNGTDGVAVSPESGKVYNDTTAYKSYRWSGTQFVQLNGGIALGETSSTAYRGDRGKTAYEHSQNGGVHVTEAQKTAWDGKAPGDHNHDAAYAALSHYHGTQVVNTEGEDINTYTIPGVYSFPAAYAPVNRPEGNTNGWLIVVSWTASTNSGTIKQIWLRHGTVNTNDHEIYVRTRNSSSWSTWAKIYTSKNPPTAAELLAAAPSLFATAANGGVEALIYAADGKNLITELEGLSTGLHTMYSQAAVEGNPNTTDAFRLLVHKVGSNIMWVMAFGATGTIYNNYCNGGTWRGWRQLYSTANPPTAAEVGAISKALQFTSDTGDVKENLSGQDVLTAIGAKGIGFYTFYSESGTTNNPQPSYGYRYLAHKTNANHGWVLAFGSDGSVFTNTLADGVWLGWKTLLDTTPTALWTGAKLMSASESITPSKPLSMCAHGWMLEWSDYDADGTANNYNIVHTPIYKKNCAGNWSGQNMMFGIPSYITDAGGTITTAIKQLLVSNTSLGGHATNDKGSPNLDVALRAVYEF